MITSLDTNSSVATDDDALIARFQDGNEQAFDALVKKHGAWAYGYAHRLTRDADDAADLTAESFLRVFRALKTFNGNCRFRTWLYTIETNAFRDLRKKKLARHTLSIDSTANAETGDTFADILPSGDLPYEVAVASSRRTELQRAVSRMRDSDQAMIAMFYQESRTYVEIAEGLDLPIGTVKSRLNRARFRLKDLLGPALSS